MKLFLVVLAGLTVSACASIEPKPFKGPSGNDAYAMKCSGFGRTLEDCYQKAGEICPAGYTIVDRATGNVAVPAQGGGFYMAPSNSLAIECKK